MQEMKPEIFTILMVDDNPKNLQLLGSTLRNEGYQLEFSTNGPTAISWLEKKNFDLILLDIMMPEMSGFEVCEHIRNQLKLADIPIIFLTAKTDKESIVKGFKIGAQDYITKPFDTSELVARVRTHLELRFNKEQLKNVNLILEEKVRERTRELQEANEKLWKANEELLRLDNAKSEFLHIISHEIRTPLNGIKGSLELIRDMAKDDTISSLFEVLEISVTRLERFAILALKITQLRTASYKLDIQPIPCKLIINTAITKFKNRCDQKNLTIVNELHNEKEIVYGDYELLTTCFLMIFDNAIKFSPENGIVRLRTELTEPLINFEVVDEGPGFSPKALENLFKFFVPGEKHVNENEGLELALAKLIMSAHNGTISASNVNGGGAMVKLTLPKDLS
jgi:two-component system, sensor histidine kinase and response regulator